jgi:uncharacterized protein YecE (DUF72 family)
MAHPVRVGVGGWNFEPWDETFYPAGLSKAKQLGFMSRKMTAVEVNATYYSSFKPDTFTKWAEAAPDGFVFSLKAHRFCTVRKTKDDMKKSVDLFFGQGVAALKEKLGPINWQFPATRKFDPDYFRMFLSVLPREVGRLPLRHALEVRGEGFDAPEFYDLLTRHGATAVYAEDDEFPKLRHEGSDFAVARLMQTKSEETHGYTAGEISRFAKMFGGWAKKQEVFAFIISGAKERNPAAAMALQQRLGVTPKTVGEADALAGGKRRAPAPRPARKKAPAKAAAPRKKK